MFSQKHRHNLITTAAMTDARNSSFTISFLVALVLIYLAKLAKGPLVLQTNAQFPLVNTLATINVQLSYFNVVTLNVAIRF